MSFLAPFFLLGLAVVDDIGAIIVIAVVYSKGFDLSWFVAAVVALGLTLLARALRVRAVLAYVPLGVAMWLGLYNAGVHPTIAGVAMGLLAPVVPITRRDLVDVEETSVGSAGAGSVSVVEWLQHLLHPWTVFAIVPVFALANTGIELSAQAWSHALRSPVAWAVFVGLVVGKPLGVAIFSLGATRAGWTSLPPGVSRRALLGIGQSAGIGFTVALFVTELAFRHGNTVDTDYVADAKMAILAASVMSGVAAYVVLRRRPAA